MKCLDCKTEMICSVGYVSLKTDELIDLEFNDLIKKIDKVLEYDKIL